MLQNLDIVLSFAVVMLLLSLVVTVLVQGAVALLDLRGRNLVTAVSLVLKQVDSSIGEADVRRIAEAVTRYEPVQSVLGMIPKLWGRAKAIRREELIRVLNRLAADAGEVPADKKSELGKALEQLLPSQGASTLSSEVTAALEVLKTAHPDQKQALDAAMQQVLPAGRKLTAGVNDWFDTVMERASDWFVAKTRIVTTILAVVVALTLQVDSFDLLRLLSRNSELRGRLVSAAEAVSRQAESILADVPVRQVIDDLRKRLPELAAEFDRVPKELASCGQAAVWLKNQPGLSGVLSESDSGCATASLASFMTSSGPRLKPWGSSSSNQAWT